jgi:hypothetical protein
MTNDELRRLVTDWTDALADAISQVEMQLQPIEIVNIVGDPDVVYPATEPLYDLLDDWRARIAVLTEEP